MTKLSSGTLILAVFAVLFGLVGAYGAKQYLLGREEQPPQPAPRAKQITIPMTSADLPAERTVAFGDIMIVQMTPAQLKERGLPPGFMTDASQVIGRTLSQPLPKGSVFLTNQFYPEGTGPSIAKRLQPGYRAVTVPLENTHSELALISPGAVVDVVFRTFADDAVSLPETTVTLLEHVDVLAIGPETFPGGKMPADRMARRQSASVTLAVTPDQASALKVVEGRGSLSLVLRGPEDSQVVGRSRPQTLASLLDLPQPDPPFTTQIYRRGRLTTAVFENGRQTILADSFDGLPVAAETRAAPVVPVSHSVATSTPRKGADAEPAKSKKQPGGRGGK